MIVTTKPPTHTDIISPANTVIYRVANVFICAKRRRSLQWRTVTSNEILTKTVAI